MKNFLKSWGLLLLAIGIGIIAFFSATTYLTSVERTLRDDLLSQGGQTIDVVVAATDINEGATVDSSNLAVAPIPAGHVSGAAITPDRFERVNGALLKVPMKSGEPLLTHFLEGSLIERFSDLLDVGQRAVTIEVDNLASNAGLLSVGDYVDIFLSGEFSSSEAEGEEESLIPLFENVRVLAADRNPLLTRQQEFRTQNLLTEEDGFEFASVTLALAADDAGTLAFASTMGDIVFLLRSPDDSKRRNWGKINSDAVLSKDGSSSSKLYNYFGKSTSYDGASKAMVSLRDNVQTASLKRLSVPVYSGQKVAEPDSQESVDGAESEAADGAESEAAVVEESENTENPTEATPVDRVEESTDVSESQNEN